MIAAELAARLKARGGALAQRRLTALQQRISANLAGPGGGDGDHNGARLTAPDLQQRRFGRRDRLADPRLLWPGEQA